MQVRKRLSVSSSDTYRLQHPASGQVKGRGGRSFSVPEDTIERVDERRAAEGLGCVLSAIDRSKGSRLPPGLHPHGLGGVVTTVGAGACSRSVL